MFALHLFAMFVVIASALGLLASCFWHYYVADGQRTEDELQWLYVNCFSIFYVVTHWKKCKWPVICIWGCLAGVIVGVILGQL